jgi:hypothetical protein
MSESFIKLRRQLEFWLEGLIHAIFEVSVLKKGKANEQVKCWASSE